MQDTHDETLGPVFRLVYRSTARIALDRRETELGAILGVARSANPRVGITGALLAWHDAFVQVLEGDESAVRRLYDTIRADGRHEPVITLDADSVPARVFPRWSMARVGDGDGVDISVRMDRDAGSATPAALKTGDPNQDTMLDLMREYVRLDVEPLT